MAWMIVLFQCIRISCSAQDRYVVTIPDLTERRVHVEAHLLVKGDLLMSPFGAQHLELGWATFVDSLKASDTSGAEVGTEIMPGGAIAIAGNASARNIRLNYTVRLEHQQHRWPFGHKEAAYILDGMLMSTGNALFITQLEMDSATVEFHVPEQYDVATAWRSTGRHTFAVKGAEELVWTVLAIGEMQRTTIPAGALEVELVHGVQLKGGAHLLQELTEQAIQEYEKIYGGPPNDPSGGGGNYLQVVNVDGSYEGGGSAFTNSISILLERPPAPCTDISSSCWHHILVHELGHLWLSRTLRADDRDQWFLEGTTDYLAYYLQRELGLWDDGQWRTMLEQKQAEYEAARATTDVPLADAGADKSTYYDLIYAGGLRFAHELDQQIRTSTNHERSLVDLMKQLYGKYAGRDQMIDRNSLQNEAEALCNCQLKGLFERLDAVE